MTLYLDKALNFEQEGNILKIKMLKKSFNLYLRK